jgi:hypothetical protein
MKLQKVTGEKKLFLVAILKVTDENSRIRIRWSQQRYGSLDPDPYQNVTDTPHYRTLTKSNQVLT